MVEIIHDFFFLGIPLTVIVLRCIYKHKEGSHTSFFTRTRPFQANRFTL